MPHPDLNELRRKVVEQETSRITKMKKKKGRKILFLFSFLLLVGYLSYYQLDMVKKHYHIASDFVTQFFGENTKVINKEKQTPIIKEIPTQYLFVQTKGANIRSEPGLESSRVTVVGENERLEYLNQFVQIDDIYWLHIQTPTGETGWISDKIVNWDDDSMDLLVADAQDNVAAMTALATFYEKGIAINEYEERALYWYKKAAENGDEKSHLLLESFQD